MASKHVLFENISDPNNGDFYLNCRHLLDLTLTFFIFIFGLIGNTLIIIIIYSNKKLFNLTISIYLITLAISDTCVLIFENLIIWIDVIIVRYNHSNKENIKTIQLLTDCKIYYFYFLFQTISSWLIVNLSIDRFIFVNYPYKHKVYLTKNTCFMRIIVVIVCSILLHIHYVIYVHSPSDADYDCISLTNEDSMFSEPAWPVIYTFIYAVVPAIIMIILNILIICKVMKAKLKIRNGNPMRRNMNETSVNNIDHIKRTTVNNTNDNSIYKITATTKNLNLTVFAICVSFLIFKLPSNIHSIYYTGITTEAEEEYFQTNNNTSINGYYEFLKQRKHVLRVLFIDRLLEQLMNLYHAINIVIYLLTSSTFRQQFIKMFNIFKKFSTHN